MLPYLGEGKSQPDGQWRVIVPAGFRAILKQEETPALVAMKGLERTITLFPYSAWERLRPQIRLADFRADREARFYQRSIYRGMEVLVPDAQGRIQLSPTLREHANITKEHVVFLGLGEFIELWSESKLELYLQSGAEFGASMEELARRFDAQEAEARRSESSPGNQDG